MFAFIISILVMTLIAVLMIFRPFKKRRPRTDAIRANANLDVLRDQMKELDLDFAAGEIGDKALREARAELDRRAIEESQDKAAEERAMTQAVAPVMPAGKKIAWGVAVFALIFVVGGALYGYIGTPAAFTAAASPAAPSEEEAHAHSLSQSDMDAMVAKFAEKLKSEPDNVEGWTVLARSYSQLGKYPEAAQAYEHLLKIQPDNADLLADYADLLGVMQNRDLTGKPMQLVEKALKIDPKNWKALALAGTYSFDQGDYKKAIQYWQTLKSTLPTNSPMVKTLDAGIKEAEGKMKN